jgi:hypothetical protein
MKLFLATFLFLALAADVFATGQVPDKLVLNGKEFDLYSNPLEAFYPNEKNRPLFMIGPFEMVSSNWRGYVASWAIENNALYLTGIDSWTCAGNSRKSCRRVTLSRLFGKRVVAGRVRADWFTGELRAPDGKQLQYVHMGYGSIYERDIIIQVKAGRVTEQTVIDNTQRVLPSELELQKQELDKIKPKSKQPSIP